MQKASTQREKIELSKNKGDNFKRANAIAVQLQPDDQSKVLRKRKKKTKYNQQVKLPRPIVNKGDKSQTDTTANAEQRKKPSQKCDTDDSVTTLDVE